MSIPILGQDLSVREKQVWDLRQQGYTRLNISQLLKISENTVKVHIGAALIKKGCSSSLELSNKFLNLTSAEDRLRDLRIAKVRLSCQLKATNDELQLLQGAVDEEDTMPVIDFSARAGIASILADMVQGRE